MKGVATEIATAVAKGVTQGSTKNNLTNRKAFLKLQLLGSYKSTDADDRKVLTPGEFTEGFDEIMKTKNNVDATISFQELLRSTAIKLQDSEANLVGMHLDLSELTYNSCYMSKLKKFPTTPPETLRCTGEFR